MILKFKQHKGIHLDKLSYKEREELEKKKSNDKLHIELDAEIGKDDSLKIFAERTSGNKKMKMSNAEISALLMLILTTLDSEDEHFQKEYIKKLNELKSIIGC